MMRQILIGLGILTLAATARAETVSGTVEASGTLHHAAVWLEGPAAPPPPHTPARLSQKGARFSPEFLVVTVGQTVDMPNDDRIAHNVFSVSPTAAFDLGIYGHGESRQVRFDKPGVVDLFCNIHDNMHAVIVVVPTTLFATVGSDGKFTIANVPPGAWRVVALSSEDGKATQSVTVAPGAGATVSLTLRKK